VTKRHFIALARLVREAHYLDDATRAQLVSDLVSLCAEANPRFSSSLFLSACQPSRPIGRVVE
jgi:hypothetical protein